MENNIKMRLEMISSDLFILFLSWAFKIHSNNSYSGYAMCRCLMHEKYTCSYALSTIFLPVNPEDFYYNPV